MQRSKGIWTLAITSGWLFMVVTDGAVVDWTPTGEEAQRFIDDVRGDDQELAAKF